MCIGLRLWVMSGVYRSTVMSQSYDGDACSVPQCGVTGLLCSSNKS